MILNISLKNFRNYKEREFSFSEKRNLIVGPNAAGKTNLLESVYLLSTGKSFRVKGVESEMIKSGEEIARARGEVEKRGEKIKLEIVLTRGMVMGEKTAKKRYFVNGIGKKASDFIGILKAVYFGPEDLDLIVGSPSGRRKYLDNVLFQVDSEYIRSSLSYEKGLRTRNKILEEIREARFQAKTTNLLNYNLEIERKKLFFWDQLLIKNGNYITAKREEFINFLNNRREIFDGLRLESQSEKFPCFNIEYDRSAISTERLAQYEIEEIAAGSTLVGPHRDDFKVILVNKEASEMGGARDLAVYGSRGEQRLAVLWMKLGELSFVKTKTNEEPILLLDDIFSELDLAHRRLVYDITGETQTIITTADMEIIDEQWLKDIKIIKL